MWRINNYQRFKFRIKLPVRYNMPNLVRKKNRQNLFGNKFEREIITSLKKTHVPPFKCITIHEFSTHSWKVWRVAEKYIAARVTTTICFTFDPVWLFWLLLFLRFKPNILGFGIIVFIYTTYYGYCFYLFFVWLRSLLRWTKSNRLPYGKSIEMSQELWDPWLNKSNLQ